MYADDELAKLSGCIEFSKRRDIAQETEVQGVPFVVSLPNSQAFNNGGIFFRTDRRLLLGKLLFCFTATSLIFFIAGLLIYLCFEDGDNLGAYSIPY